MIEVFMEMICTVVGASRASQQSRNTNSLRTAKTSGSDPARSSFETGPFGGYLKNAVSSEVRGKAGPCKHDIYWVFLIKKNEFGV